MSKRAVLYARVSTDDQADRGYSLPSQIEACREYATRLNYVVVEELREDHSGATPIAERPQGKKLSALIRDRDVDAVIVYQVDRLSRDIVDLLATVRTWLRSGVEVHAGDVGNIESELDIVLVIKGWQGSDERKKIRERSMRGKRAKAQSGRVVGGRCPYGYQHVRDEHGKVVTFEPLEEEASIVQLIYRWYVVGDDNGKCLSACNIARRLSEMRIPTPGETNRGYNRKRESGMWQPDKVIKILSHELYAGVWRFGGRIGNSRHMRPIEEQIAVNVPAIIDRDTWEMAQMQKERNRQYSKRNAKRDYLLSGLISCGCRSAMCGEYFSDHRYYTCSWKNNHHTGIEKRACRERSVRADAIENDVWDSIIWLFNDLTKFEQLLRTAQAKEMTALDPKREELDAIEAMIIDTEREADELDQALRIASGIVGKKLTHDMEIVNQRYDAMCKRRDDLHGELKTRRLTDEAIHEAISFAQDIRAGIVNADFETKRRNLEMLQVQVTVKDGQFLVNSLAGSWDGAIRKLPIAPRKSKQDAVVDAEDIVIVNASHSPEPGLPGYRFP